MKKHLLTYGVMTLVFLTLMGCEQEQTRNLKGMRIYGRVVESNEYLTKVQYTHFMLIIPSQNKVEKIDLHLTLSYLTPGGEEFPVGKEIKKEYLLSNYYDYTTPEIHEEIKRRLISDVQEPRVLSTD